MKAYILIIAFILILGKASAQKVKPIDIIYANDQKNVALFFPAPIRQGITGTENFVFTYNRDKQQYFGLLQAKPGKESNLLVINTDGSIFSYILRYKKQLAKLNYFIPKSNRIGNEKPVLADPTKAPQEEEIENKTYYYQKFCSYLIDRKQRIGRIKKRKHGIVLSVENIVFDKEELYFVIQIENKSSLDYDLNFLKLSIRIRKKGKKKSLQTLLKEPVFKYNIPLKIKEDETLRMIYVLPKFSISNNRRAILQLNEKNGERDIELKVSHRFIDNPN